MTLFIKVTTNFPKKKKNVQFSQNKDSNKREYYSSYYLIYLHVYI